MINAASLQDVYCYEAFYFQKPCCLRHLSVWHPEAAGQIFEGNAAMFPYLPDYKTHPFLCSGVRAAGESLDHSRFCRVSFSFSV